MSKVIQQQEKYKILLIGETCLDVYVFGLVERLNPEAPVPIIKKTSKLRKEGMSGNVLKNLESMMPNLDVTCLQNEFGTIKKIRFIDDKSKYQLLRYDIEEDVKPLRIERVPEREYDAIVISDYDKGFITTELVSELKKRFKDTPVFVDTKKKNLKCFSSDSGRVIVKVNQHERDQSLNSEMCEVITTLGPRGCEYLGRIYEVDKVDVHDVCGAGDVFLAALVIRWLETKDMNSAIKTANNCAALSVTKLGTYTVGAKEYENLCV